ncbi:unnamed protein product [Moneuplotes crassus]|uniref:Uncharacterized protein n=1 Tax=Euplotes crassus TaxID=5936 RepID=A0AAD1Y3J5_EUPCR|nr:unnamed protein product [Moneuplotes crassus]
MEKLSDSELYELETQTEEQSPPSFTLMKRKQRVCRRYASKCIIGGKPADGNDEAQEKLLSTILPNTIEKKIDLPKHKLISGSAISRDGRYYIVGGRNYLSVFDSITGEYQLKKSCKLSNIAHHLTSIDYNDYSQKILVTTLNEKVQIHNLELDVEEASYMKLKECPAGHFLLEYDDNRCAVFDTKFSEKDGSKCIVLLNNGFSICDLEENKVITNVANGHWEEVNSVMTKPFGLSENTIVTGGDDALVNIYDKRTIGSKEGNKACGKFFGHNAGITSVDITESGNYIASNGKDQLIKLWDIRKALPQDIYTKTKRKYIDFDYRNTSFNKSKRFVHEADNSVYTFKGHTTHYTQIRCKFSPSSWTNERFIASGSFCGCTIIYDTYTGEKLGALAPASKSIAKIPTWHPLERKLMSTSENKFFIYEHDPEKTTLKSCVGKVDLHSKIQRKFKKLQKEEVKHHTVDSCKN